MDNYENQQPVIKKNRIKPIHFAVIALVLFVSFMVVFLIFKNISSPNEDAKEKISVGPIYTTSEFTVNLAETNGKRYLKAQLSLEADHKKVLKELAEKLPVLEDKVITVLSRQRIEDLEQINGKEKIKEQLQESINNILVQGEIVKIYFNHFVWQ